MVEAPGITKFEAAEVACRGEAFGVGFGEDDLLAICFGDGGRRGGGCFGFLAGEGGMVEGLCEHTTAWGLLLFPNFSLTNKPSPGVAERASGRSAEKAREAWHDRVRHYTWMTLSPSMRLFQVHVRPLADTVGRASPPSLWEA